VISIDAVATLARVYLQTLGLSLAFVGTGQFIHRRLLTRDRPAAGSSSPDAPTLDSGSAYFLGLSVFLLAFVFVSRVSGARSALWIALAGMATASALHGMSNARVALRRAGQLVVALLPLTAFYSVTNVALWLGHRPGTATIAPSLFAHFGSIHSGRYANYAILIAQSDRVPRLAQNAGQSILASVHLLLGVNSPLADVMVWVPFSLAFLTILIFSLFRSLPMAVVPCLAATFLIMFCNVAVSLVHVLVFDNGSPLAFIGYTDMIAAVATFIILCRWFTRELSMEHPGPASRLLLPALLAITWCWHAPQNIVLAASSFAATALVWLRRYPSDRLRRRLRNVGLALVSGLCVGATQLGTFLPASLREETGLWTQPVEATTVALRPYTLYLTGHWTDQQWNFTFPTENVYLRPYENTIARAWRIGPDQVYRRVTWFLEEQLWASIRVYGFPLIGLGLFGAYLRRQPPPHDHRQLATRVWLLLSLFSFGSGYAVCFGLELGHLKWWLSRFLVPGSAMALTCLGFGALGYLEGGTAATSRLNAPSDLFGLGSRRLWWVLLVVVATVGPVAELVSVSGRNFLRRVDPIGHRLMLLTQTKGPFLFESFVVRDAAASAASGGFLVGGDGRQQGLAIYSPAIYMKAGAHRVGYHITLAPPLPPDSTLLLLDVTVDQGTVVVARRPVRAGDLEQRVDGDWAWLDFDLPKDASDAQFRLWNTSAAAFEVGAMRFER
jgi:hypothetical protein